MDRRQFLAVSAAGAAVSALAGCDEKDEVVYSYPRDPSAYPPLGRIVTVDGLEVHTADFGRKRSGPPVVLIHGASANLRDWTFQNARRIARKTRVVAVDRPGFGYSERGSGDWSPSRQAAQLRAAVRRMGVRKPIVVGHSWGAAVALAWGLDAPEDVAGVVSVSGVTRRSGVGLRILSALGAARSGVRSYTERLAERVETGRIGPFIDRVFSPLSPPSGYVKYVGVPLAAQPQTLAATESDFGELQSYLRDQTPRYSGMRVPVEILHGDRDALLDEDRHAKELAKALPRARLTIARGVGHMLHHARPDLVEAAIKRLSV